MKADLDVSLAKLMNPRMSAGLMVLYSLLDGLMGPSVQPRDVRSMVDKAMKGRKVSKQSITNAARRLEESNMLNREDGYSVNYGYLISVLLNAVLELSERLRDLEDEIENLKSSSEFS